MTQSLKEEEKEKQSNNEKLQSQNQIRLPLMNMEKNNLKVSDDEVKAEIQKQIKGMPDKKRWFLIIIKKLSASQSLKGSIYEEKIITLIKSKIKLEIKNINTKEAEEIISEFNKAN